MEQRFVWRTQTSKPWCPEAQARDSQFFSTKLCKCFIAQLDSLLVHRISWALYHWRWTSWLEYSNKAPKGAQGWCLSVSQYTKQDSIYRVYDSHWAYVSDMTTSNSSCFLMACTDSESCQLACFPWAKKALSDHWSSHRFLLLSHPSLCNCFSCCYCRNSRILQCLLCGFFCLSRYCEALTYDIGTCRKIESRYSIVRRSFERLIGFVGRVRCLK